MAFLGYQQKHNAMNGSSVIATSAASQSIAGVNMCGKWLAIDHLFHIMQIQIQFTPGEELRFNI